MKQITLTNNILCFYFTKSPPSIIASYFAVYHIKMADEPSTHGRGKINFRSVNSHKSHKVDKFTPRVFRPQ